MQARRGGQEPGAPNGAGYQDTMLPGPPRRPEMRLAAAMTLRGLALLLGGSQIVAGTNGFTGNVFRPAGGPPP